MGGTQRVFRGVSRAVYDDALVLNSIILCYARARAMRACTHGRIKRVLARTKSISLVLPNGCVVRPADRPTDEAEKKPVLLKNWNPGAVDSLAEHARELRALLRNIKKTRKK